MKHKLIMENWRAYVNESNREEMSTLLNHIFNEKELTSSVSVENLFPQAEKMAGNWFLKSAGSHDLIGFREQYRKVKKIFEEGDGSQYLAMPAWASYHSDVGEPGKNMMVFWKGTWKKFILKTRNFLVNTIISNLHYDHRQQMSSEDFKANLDPKFAKKIKDLILRGAALMVASTLVHEMTHVDQHTSYKREDYENPKFEAWFENDAHAMMMNFQDEFAEAEMKKISEQIFQNLYLMLLDSGADQYSVNQFMESDAGSSVSSFLVNSMKALIENCDRMNDMYTNSSEDDYSVRYDPEQSYIAKYEVKRGDSLYKIARRYNINFREILRANKNLKDPSKIYVGQEIIIPQPTDSDTDKYGVDYVEPRLKREPERKPRDMIAKADRQPRSKRGRAN